MHDPRIDRLAAVLVGYSVNVQPGDLVSLVGPPLAEPVLVALYREVLRAGGHPIVHMAPESCAEELYRHGSATQLSYVSPLEIQEVECVDAAIHVAAATNTRAHYGVDPARQALRNRARGPLMETFLKRAARKVLRWVVTQFPCPAAAQDAEMALTDYEEFVYGAGLINRPDCVATWQARSQRQAALAEFLSTRKEIHFLTARGTDLRVGVAGRTWRNGDGHENFPDGEVFTSPIEDATEGTVVFDFPALKMSREVDDVRLVFRAGRVVDASAGKGADFLIRLLDQDGGARVLGEVAMGCNYAIGRHTRNTLFDEKIGGTFHVALGSSYPETGGLNSSGLHWDLVSDLRQGGRIEADGQLISEQGRFLSNRWPQPDQ